MNKRQRKKNCRVCGTKYGRRTFRGGNVFCSTVCRARWEEEKLIDKIDAALKWEPPQFRFGTYTGRLSSAKPNLQVIPHGNPNMSPVPYPLSLGKDQHRLPHRRAEGARPGGADRGEQL